MSSKNENIQMDKKPLTIVSLPNEIIERILKNLNYDTITSCMSSVSSRFNVLSDKIMRNELGRLRGVLKNLLDETRNDYKLERNKWMSEQGNNSLIYLIRLAARFMLLRITQSELNVMQALCRRARCVPGCLLDVANELVSRLGVDPLDEEWILNTSGQHITSKADGLLRINSKYSSYFYKTNERWLGLFIVDILECCIHCESRITVLHEEDIPEEGSEAHPSGECTVHGFYEVIIPETTFQPLPPNLESDSFVACELIFLFLHNAVRSSNKGLTVSECTQGMERNISQVCTLRKNLIGDSSLSFLQEINRTVASSSQLLSNGKRCVATHFIMRFNDILLEKPQPTIRIDFEMTCPVNQLSSSLVPKGTLNSSNDCIFSTDRISPYKFRMTLRQRMANDLRPVSETSIILLVYENSPDNIIIRQFSENHHTAETTGKEENFPTSNPPIPL